MKFEAKNGKRIKVVDSLGKEVPLVKSYDTVTKEAELFIRGPEGVIVTGRGGAVEALVVKAVLLGSRAIDKDTGQEIA